MKFTTWMKAGFLGLMMSTMVWTSAYGMTEETKQWFSEVELILSYQGIGTLMPYHAGITKEAYEAIPAVQKNKVVVAGNSSGSITAVFLGCHGFNDDSIYNKMYTYLRTGTPEILAHVKYLKDSVEDPRKKIEGFLNRGSDGIPFIDISNLDPYIKSAIGVKNLNDLSSSPCYDDDGNMKLPTVVVAANKEVVDNKADGDLFTLVGISDAMFAAKYMAGMDVSKHVKFRSRNEKVFNVDDFSISWTDGVYKKYTMDEAGKALYAKNNPDLLLTPTTYIGKSCTYFASPRAYQLLKMIPWEELLCDLRLVDTPKGWITAIQASSAEPSLFKDVLEPEPEKLYVNGEEGSLGYSKRRKYWGGVTVPLVAQGLRRMLPEAYVLATGWYRLGDMGNDFIKAVLLVDSNEAALRNEYWADVSIMPTRDQAEKIAKKTMEWPEAFEAGCSRARDCFGRSFAKNPADRLRTCFARSIRTPKYAMAAEHAIWRDEDAKTDKKLKGARTIGALLDKNKVEDMAVDTGK